MLDAHARLAANNGVCYSIYDSHTWQTRYGDPGFHKHTAAAKMLGLMSKRCIVCRLRYRLLWHARSRVSFCVALRIADAILLPFNLTQYAQDLSLYLAK